MEPRGPGLANEQVAEMHPAGPALAARGVRRRARAARNAGARGTSTHPALLPAGAPVKRRREADDGGPARVPPPAPRWNCTGASRSNCRMAIGLALAPRSPVAFFFLRTTVRPGVPPARAHPGGSAWVRQGALSQRGCRGRAAHGPSWGGASGHVRVFVLDHRARGDVGIGPTRDVPGHARVEVIVRLCGLDGRLARVRCDWEPGLIGRLRLHPPHDPRQEAEVECSRGRGRRQRRSTSAIAEVAASKPVVN